MGAGSMKGQGGQKVKIRGIWAENDKKSRFLKKLGAMLGHFQWVNILLVTKYKVKVRHLNCWFRLSQPLFLPASAGKSRLDRDAASLFLLLLLVVTHQPHTVAKKFGMTTELLNFCVTSGS